MAPARTSGRRRRETNRKRLLRDALESTYPGRAVLLDELRWTVMATQFDECQDGKARRSLMNSFARTVREHLNDHVIAKVSLTRLTPVGLVARAAVYRLWDAGVLRGFLNAEDPCILCRYKTNFDVEEARYAPRSRFVTPKYHAATFRFFEREPGIITYDELEAVPGTFIPATHKLTLIVPRGTTADLPSIANVPWKLLAFDDLRQWREVKGCATLESVQRNRHH